MRTRLLICAAIGGAVLAAPPPSMAQSEDSTVLSGVDVVIKKPEPTPLAGVDVVAHRSTHVSEVDVVLPPCPKANGAPDAEIPIPKVVSTFPAKGAVVRPGAGAAENAIDRRDVERNRI